MDKSLQQWGFIIDKDLKRQSIKLNVVIIIITAILLLVMFIRVVNIYINKTDGYIIDNCNILKSGGFNLNYLLEQKYFKTLKSDDQKKYLELTNSEKLSNIKKYLINSI